jgi:hypothetical protein
MYIIYSMSLPHYLLYYHYIQINLVTSIDKFIENALCIQQALSSNFTKQRDSRVSSIVNFSFVFYFTFNELQTTPITPYRSSILKYNDKLYNL